MEAATVTPEKSSAAYRMLATRCAVCARNLRDPVSVELGIGPDCRKAYAFTGEGLSSAAYERARVLVFQLALEASAKAIVPANVLIAADELREIGLSKLADVLVDRNARIRVKPHGADAVLVSFPYSMAASFEIGRLGGTVVRDDSRPSPKDGRGAFVGYAVPVANRNAVWSVLRRHFVGLLGVGPRGPFVVTAIEVAS